MKIKIKIVLFMIGLLLSLTILQIQWGRFNSSSELMFRLKYLENGDLGMFCLKNILVEFVPSTSKKDEVEILSPFGRVYAADFPHQYMVKLKPGLESGVVDVALDKLDSVAGAEPALNGYPMRTHQILIAFKPLTPKVLEIKILGLMG